MAEIMAKYRNIQRLGLYYCQSSSRSSNIRLWKVPRICWEMAEGRRADNSSFFSHIFIKSIMRNNKTSQWTVRLTFCSCLCFFNGDVTSQCFALWQLSSFQTKLRHGFGWEYPPRFLLNRQCKGCHLFLGRTEHSHGDVSYAGTWQNNMFPILFLVQMQPWKVPNGIEIFLGYSMSCKLLLCIKLCHKDSFRFSD